MSAEDPLDTLKARYPFFLFKNKTDMQQHVSLADGETVPCMPRGVIKLQSNRFHQLPSTNIFEFKQPTMADLRDLGLVAGKSIKVDNDGSKTVSDTKKETAPPAPKNNPPSSTEEDKK